MRPRSSRYSLKKYPRIHSPGNHTKKAIKDHGHNVARKRRELTERCARHQVNGAFILVPATPAMIPTTADAKPPPTRNRMIESRIRTRPPFFL